MYVIFEGIDTSGKSTQIGLLSKKFKNVITTKEPGGTEFGIWARELLLNGSLTSKRSELLLFLTDRAEHYERIIKPNRDKKLILSDRGFLSGIGYALANGDFKFDHLVELNRFALCDDFPDLVIFFEIDITTLKQRMKNREKDKIEQRGFEYLISVQEHIKESLEKLNIPYLLINATENIETIHIQIYEKLTDFPLKEWWDCNLLN